MTSAQNGSGRIPSLDGLRAISILMVIAGHAYQGYTGKSPDTPLWLIGANAAFGVEVFFVISGYLITSLLLKEVQKTNDISLRDFYIRRTFRIFPALWFYVLVVCSLSLLGAIKPVSIESVLSAITFTTNYSPFGNSALEHTWSLSVEEQFYLIWPATLYISLLYGSKKTASIVCLSIIAASPIIRIATSLLGNEFMSKHIYFMLHTRLDALMFGCLLALSVGSKKFEQIFSRSTPAILPLALFALVVSPLLTARFGGSYIYIIGYTVECSAISLAMLWAVRNPSSAIGQILNNRSVVYIGTLSYSLYLWQELTLKSGLMPPNYILASIALAFILAALSYHLVETPALKMRKRLERKSGVQVFDKRGNVVVR